MTAATAAPLKATATPLKTAATEATPQDGGDGGDAPQDGGDGGDAPQDGGDGGDAPQDGGDGGILSSVQEILELEYDTERSRVIPPRVRTQKSKIKYFQSPVPFDRHMNGLSRCGLHKKLKNAILNGKASDNLTIVHGPPGTERRSNWSRIMLRSFQKTAYLFAPPQMSVRPTFTPV